jgi:hypothetical protein
MNAESSFVAHKFAVTSRQKVCTHTAIFILGLFNDAASNLHHVAPMVKIAVNAELEKIWMWLWLNLEYAPCIWLEELRKKV